MTGRLAGGPRRGRQGGDGGPRPLAASLDEALADLEPPRRGGGQPGGGAPAAARSATWGTVFGRWDEVVGAALARHARPVRIEGDTLVVAVDRPPWATQVRVLAPAILEGLAGAAGERLERVEVVVRPADVH